MQISIIKETGKRSCGNGQQDVNVFIYMREQLGCVKNATKCRGIRRKFEKQPTRYNLLSMRNRLDEELVNRLDEVL